jgi:phosphoribosyl-AMP cyclohydrolase
MNDTVNPNALDWEKMSLIPVVVQEYDTKAVLMLAYTDRNALEATISTGYAHYFSRTRVKLWKKGETSGNVQKIMEIRVDCDRDTLLYLVKQTGAACHTGNISCFYRLLKG